MGDALSTSLATVLTSRMQFHTRQFHSSARGSINYYPVEWMASFLDKEPEKRKERAINIAKANGFEIVEADVNTSSFVWEIRSQ